MKTPRKKLQITVCLGFTSHEYEKDMELIGLGKCERTDMVRLSISQWIFRIAGHIHWRYRSKSSRNQGLQSSSQWVRWMEQIVHLMRWPVYWYRCRKIPGKS